MYYIVPPEDQTPEGFVVPGLNGLFVAMPLEKNPLEKLLRPLALWLNGIRGANSLKKSLLIAELTTHISTLPLSAARARWPELAVKEGSATTLEFYTEVRRLEGLKYTIARTTPEFTTHANLVLEEARVAMRDALEKRQKEKAAEKTKKAAPPEWLRDARRDPLQEDYYTIRVELVDQEHDGYCSGIEEDELTEKEDSRETVIYYVPAALWTFETKEWSLPLSSHCCCGAATIYRIQSVERSCV
jgi:hypothetical protein